MRNQNKTTQSRLGRKILGKAAGNLDAVALDATYYNWRKQYGQMKLNQVKQLKVVQKENSQLKKLVADLSLDNAILKEALSGNY